MCNPTSHNALQSLRTEAGQATEAPEKQSLPGALPFLLYMDPEAIIEVNLVDEPVDLPKDQFQALLFESECEV